MPIMIHGKEYLQVAERLKTFHTNHPNGAIFTEIILPLSNGESVVMKATVIPDISQPTRFFTGHAREIFTKIGINQKSAYENSETSSIGRALASAGYAGSEFASADELIHKLSQTPKSLDTMNDSEIETVLEEQKSQALYDDEELPTSKLEIKYTEVKCIDCGKFMTVDGLAYCNKWKKPVICYKCGMKGKAK